MEPGHQKERSSIAGATSEASEMVVRFSDVFIATPTASIDEAIEAALRDIGHYTEAACCYIMQIEAEEERFICTHQWSEDRGVSKTLASCAVALDQVGWLLERVKKDQFVYVSDPALLPPDAAGERRLFDAKGVDALAAVPIEGDDDLVGCVVLQGLAGSINEETTLLLRRMGQLFAGAFRRQAAERVVTQSEPQYRVLFEKANAPVLVIRPDDEVILDANPAAARTYGLPRDELRGSSLKAFTADVERGEAQIDRVLRRGTVENFETVHRRADDTRMQMLVSCAAIRYEGEPAVLCTLSDITEQKEAEERLRKSEQALRRSKQRWRALVEHHPNAVFITIGGEVQYANPATALLFGANAPEALIGRSIFEFLPKEVKPTIRDRIAALEQGEATAPLQHPLIGADGETRIIEVNSVPIIYKGQRAVQTVGRDVTERHRYEEQLLEAKDEAERARAEAEEMNRLKSAFLANMSHEVRTPLAAIIGFAEALSEEVQSTEETAAETRSAMVAEFAGLIQRSGRRLLTTLNSVLDLSSLEAGTMRVKIERINVSREIRETAALFRQRAREAGVDVQLDLEEAITAELDASALHRILHNLLSNAIKFTGDGGRVLIEANSDETHAWIAVEDTGIGISEAFLPKLFDAFKQESTGISRKHEGVGLGLAVTQQLVSLMDGTIDVESEKGVGTRFTVCVPRHRVPEVEEETEDKVITKGSRRKTS